MRMRATEGALRLPCFQPAPGFEGRLNRPGTADPLWSGPAKGGCGRMSAVRLAIGCGVVAVLVAGHLSRVSTDASGGLWSTVSQIVGGGPSPRMAAVAPDSRQPAEPGRARAAGGTESILPDRYGQYQTAVEIEGQRLPVLIDTGASSVVLSFEDADRLGIRPMPADFTIRMWTANGSVMVAPVRLPRVRVGSIEVSDVEAQVSTRGVLAKTLLGMSFLRKLGGFRVERGRLVLEQ